MKVKIIWNRKFKQLVSNKSAGNVLLFQKKKQRDHNNSYKRLNEILKKSQESLLIEPLFKFYQDKETRMMRGLKNEIQYQIHQLKNLNCSRFNVDKEETFLFKINI